MKRAGLLATFALVVAGCAHTTTGAGFGERVASLDPAEFTCCGDPEKFYPAPLAKGVFALAGAFAPGAGAVRELLQETGARAKLEGKAEARAAILARLQPLDIVVTGTKNNPWAHIVPGRFNHDLIYLGTEEQLRALGLWHRPSLAPLHADIRAGRVFVEAVIPEARAVDADRVMEVDTLAILRPELERGAHARAYRAIAESIGASYDFAFDVRTTDRLVCTELIHVALPELRLRIREAYGKLVIFPDDVVAQAIRGERMALVGYMVGTHDGFAWRGVHSLMGDIAAHWGLPEAPG